MDTADDKKLSYFKWEVKDTDALSEVFTNEQIGALFLAVMHTVKTGEKVEPSDAALKYPYLTLFQKVESSQKKYNETCRVRAISGAKGGKAKAANAEKAKEKEQGFKPPSKTEFRNIAKHIYNKYFEHCKFDTYEIDTLFEQYKNQNWSFNNQFDITTNGQIEAILYAKAMKDNTGEYIGFKLLSEVTKAYPEKLKELNGNRMDEWYGYYDDSSRVFEAYGDNDSLCRFKDCKDFLNWFYEDED